MTPSVKRMIGLSLIAVSILATAIWAYASLRARELVGSPFVWAVFIVAFCWGIVLLPSAETETDEKVKKSLRKRLVLVFLAIAATTGMVFLLVHILLGNSMRPSQSYTPLSVVTALLAYAWYYRNFGKRAGVGGVVVPILFFIGIVFAPVMVIEIYNTSHEDVVNLGSPREIPAAASNYVSFRYPDVAPEKVLAETYHSSRDKKHNASYTALIPVRTGRVDTLFDTWIVLFKEEYYPLSLGDTVIGQRERALYAWCRDRVKNFPYDSVVFYDRSKLNHRSVLEERNYPIQAEAIVLEPVFVSFKEYARSGRITYLAIFGVVVLFFWFATAFYDPKTD